MTQRPQPQQWFSSLLQQAPDPVAAAGALERLELPNRKQEAWRYTDLTRLYQQVFSPPADASAMVQASGFSDWVYPSGESYRLVLVNGRFDEGLSDLPQDKPFTLAPISQVNADGAALLKQYLAASHEFNQDAFDELNRAIHADGFLLHVKANTRVDRPVEVVHLNVSSSTNALAAPRSLMVLENGAEACVLERYTGMNNPVYFFNGLTRIELKPNARLSHQRLQDESEQSYHLDRVYLSQQAASAYRGVSLASGACWARSDTVVNLDGSGAECDLAGLYTVVDQQYNDMHIDVRHLQPHCRSSEHFKGILAGAGRAVFDGRILVEQDAQKSDAQLSNKNLLLSENAEVDTKPQLEIYADDVKCSHGTTVGKLDPNQLFYCRARGIEESQAIQLLSIGFAEQVLNAIDDESVKQAVHQQIAKVLDRKPGV